MAPVVCGVTHDPIKARHRLEQARAVAIVVPPVALLPLAVAVPPLAIVVPPVTVVVPPVALLLLASSRG
jgi:hypothetical protein